MNIVTFSRGDRASEADQAEKLLEKSEIHFRELHSNDPGPPIVITDRSTFSYKGLEDIKKFCASVLN